MSKFHQWFTNRQYSDLIITPENHNRITFYGKYVQNLMYPAYSSGHKWVVILQILKNCLSSLNHIFIDEVSYFTELCLFKLR